MNSLTIALISAGCIFSGVLLGMFLRRLLPDHHLSNDSKDTVKLAAGMIATLSALILGLLVSSAKGTFDTMNAEITQSAAKIILLDRVLATYGPETGDVREQFRRVVASGIESTWPEKTTGVSGLDYANIVISGGSANRALADQATIGGGGNNTAESTFSTVVGGGYNTAAHVYAIVGGGQNNTAAGDHSAVLGGSGNNASGYESFIGGGDGDTASGEYAALCGGIGNLASGDYAAVGGGRNNAASGPAATVAGGYGDTAAGSFSFAVGASSAVPDGEFGSAAFNGQVATASNQLRCGTISKAGGSFTIDDPVDPSRTILNHYFIEGPEMRNLYDGEAKLDASGRAVVTLPAYFDALNRNPRVQLTGVGTSGVMYVAEDVSGNQFTIGGPAGARVYWQVTGERKDVSAEAIRRMMPVEQPKTGPLAGRMLDDDFLAGCMVQLVRDGKAQGLDFRTAAGRAKYERIRQLIEGR